MKAETIHEMAREAFPVKEKRNKKGTGVYDPNYARRTAYMQGLVAGSEYIQDALLEWAKEDLGPMAYLQLINEINSL